MNTHQSTCRPFTLVCGLVLLLALPALILGQRASRQPNIYRITNTQPVPNGAKMKFEGAVIERDADTFTIRDRNRADYQVLLTNNTSIKTHSGFFTSGKKFAATDILRGLIVEVEGRGDSQGQLVADKVRFNESDMRAAITTDTRLNPVEEGQRHMSGQIDELHTIAAEARSEARAAHERISALDDYDVQESVTVHFTANSAVLSPEARRRLDTLAGKTLNAKSFMIEVGRVLGLNRERSDKRPTQPTASRSSDPVPGSESQDSPPPVRLDGLRKDGVSSRQQ